MVGIDLLPDADLLFEIDAHVSPDTAERFGQCDRRSAVQDAHGLLSSMIHWHGRTQEVMPDFNKADPEVLDHGPWNPLGESVDRERSEPDAHSVEPGSGRGERMITPTPCYDWQP